MFLRTKWRAFGMSVVSEALKIIRSNDMMKKAAERLPQELLVGKVVLPHAGKKLKSSRH